MEVFFPCNSFIVNQSAGIDKETNTNRLAESHTGYKAIDFESYSDHLIFAPCDLTCIFHQRYALAGGGQSAYHTVFKSDQEITCADGTKGYLLIYCVHGALEATKRGIVLKVGQPFKKDEPFYVVGEENGFNSEGKPVTVGAHIHMNVALGDFNGFDKNYQGYLYLKNDKYIEDVFYIETNNSVTFNTAYIDAYKFTFKERKKEKFIPIGKPNGWHLFNGDRYYVKNQACLTGWQNLTGYEASMLLEYFYFDTNGVMQINKFISSGSKWYFVNEKGVMVKSTWITYPLASGERYYLTDDGSMVSNQWFYYESEWYYLNAKGAMVTGWFEDPNGGWYFMNDGRIANKLRGVMVRSSWIAERDSKWYYVNSGGAMISNGQAYIGGRWYKFDISGCCVENAGSTSRYPNTPEIKI